MFFLLILSISCWAGAASIVAEETNVGVAVFVADKHIYVWCWVWCNCCPLVACPLLQSSVYLPSLEVLFQSTPPLRAISCKALPGHSVDVDSLHTDPLFSKLKLLKLDDLYKQQLGIYMYKSTKGLLPDSMSSMVIPIHNVHDHNLRNQNGYYIQHVRTTAENLQYITLDQYSGIHYPYS